MTNQEILTEAISLAIAGGWKPVTIEREPKPLASVSEVVEYWDFDWADTPYHTFWLIFNHEFAKALWGGAAIPGAEEIDDNNVKLGLYSAKGGGYEGYGDYVELWFDGQSWQYHLQQMVIADDPIKYLGGNIEAEQYEAPMNQNIKVNKDGTISPIDSGKPSVFTTKPTQEDKQA